MLVKLDDDGVVLRESFLRHYLDVREGFESSWPRWWGHFVEWSPAVRAKDEAAEAAARHSRAQHAWSVTRSEWPHRFSHGR
jgi:hypothetical protein